MTEQSVRWQALSHRISQVYAKWPTVKATAIEGSVAVGMADDASDIDISVFCTDLPSEDESKTAVEMLNAGRWKRHNDFMDIGIVRDCFWLEGGRVDVGHVLMNTVDYAFNAVLEDLDTAPVMQGFVGGFLNCMPMYGQDVVEAWISRAKAYPDGLRVAMVEKHMWMDPLWIPEIYDTKRGDFLFLQKSYVSVTENVLGMLLGLNCMYQRGEWKRIESLIVQMSIVPANLYDRLKAPFRLPTDKGVAALSEVVEETFDLVEQHLPQLDVDGARESFRTDTDTEGE